MRQKECEFIILVEKRETKNGELSQETKEALERTYNLITYLYNKYGHKYSQTGVEDM
ncbi:hypothetical protein DNHGIG_00780 [Collibacillus ludicampi]|uniref:Uncharacterized protein n=1 Tax=Collibacillus ludicampi TaxID=2771369 RepID=A0AAV4L9W7_9BACL|nr:hypothetical protein [Collibacillus ludicampi]GIM44529.1 hypothetical protein DNHGIG_00780 [Collibacillus ludicampi]